MTTDFIYAITFASLSYDAEGNLTEVSSGVDTIFDSISDAVDAMEREFNEYDEDGIKTFKGIKSKLISSEEKTFQGYTYHNYCDKTRLYGGCYSITHMRLTQIHKKHVHIGQ